ncbi:MAG: CPBP family intramembrane metalloprotease [Phycisphaerae bacterium]|nr:CPBP family intramembrane metalloprotease [Phycisphaerae bacterium]
MSDVVSRKPDDRTQALGEAQSRCRYCGAPLVPGFYFCLACGTPYKPIANVLPPSRPIKPTAGMLIERKAPHVWALFWTYFGVVLASSIIATVLLDEYPLAQLVFLDATMLVTTCVWGALHWRALAVQLKRIGLFRWEMLAGLVGLAGLLAINYGYHGWLRELFDAESIVDRFRASGVSRAVLIASFCVLPAVVEEISFRGLLQHWLHTAVRPITALLLSSALFAALHFSIISGWYLFAVGMLLGVLRWRTGSLYPCMLVHFLHNLVVLEMF